MTEEAEPIKSLNRDVEGWFQAADGIPQRFFIDFKDCGTGLLRSYKAKIEEIIREREFSEKQEKME